MTAHVLEVSDGPKAFGWCSCRDWSTGPRCDATEVELDHADHVHRRTPLCGTCKTRHEGRYCPEQGDTQ